MFLFKNSDVSSGGPPPSYCCKRISNLILIQNINWASFLPLVPPSLPPSPLVVFQVEVEVESMDKAGNFIGWLHIEGVNLSVALVENALSKVHFTAERSAYYKTLVAAEEGCRQRKEKVGFI